MWDDESVVFVVVVNDEEQYSIWPAVKPVPDGWRPDGYQGFKKDCLDHIDRVWVDMRPKSIRQNP